ncbi:hypothetical protein [Mannheimia pernigra]|uniref:Lipoprotein n=1 Tax=Mannheimia pernigra TaxID=111844 RepID=A0A7D5DXG3_9PAST|nr:hypothetical protein [Mannheimia pernigra]QLB40519.1 hypothetical protein HV559_06345 [Mannheimia pernigra]
MKIIIFYLFLVVFLTSCCEKIIYNNVENMTQRQYKIECLRLNSINFALKDDGTILIIGEKSVRKYNKLKNIFYTASTKGNLEICTPSTTLEK